MWPTDGDSMSLVSHPWGGSGSWTLVRGQGGLGGGRAAPLLWAFHSLCFRHGFPGVWWPLLFLCLWEVAKMNVQQ